MAGERVRGGEKIKTKIKKKKKKTTNIHRNKMTMDEFYVLREKFNYLYDLTEKRRKIVY